MFCDLVRVKVALRDTYTYTMNVLHIIILSTQYKRNIVRKVLFTRQKLFTLLILILILKKPPHQFESKILC